jgi:hypothetical protein
MGMKHPASSSRFRTFAWRSFCRGDGKHIEGQLRAKHSPCCPMCGSMLEARPTTRVRSSLVLDAVGYDLDCRDCRRFWCVVQHTARSIRLIRMRRLVAAVRAAGRARSGAWERERAGGGVVVAA